MSVSSTPSPAPAGGPPIAEKLAAFACSLRAEDIPAPVRARAKQLILDALGVALASTTYEFAARAHDGVCALADGPGDCSVIGMADGLPLRDAVLMNGVLLHGLDFDDSHLTGMLHPTVSCLPASLGVAERTGAAGRDLLAAYIVGMEAAIRIGASVRGGFHHVGFHATGLVSHFASALAAGRLYGLDTAQLTAAQGVAGSTASAIQVFLETGAWTKRMHPGWGAVGGITAARLAQHGFEAPARVYEGRFGLFETHLQDYAKDVDYDRITAGLGETWDLLDVAVKPYPACHFTHGAADAAVELHGRGGFAPDEVTRIRAYVPGDTLPIVSEPAEQKRRPANEYDAKFSTQYVVAACLLRGRFGLAELTDAAMKDADILRLAGMVECAADPKSAYPAFFSGGVAVTTRDGQEHVSHVRVNSGAGERALDGAAIAAKFTENAALAISRDRAAAVRDQVLSLENAGARDLMQALRVR
jgi:2-methylcitrate dehydratase PrpD